jgi:carbamate kinase
MRPIVIALGGNALIRDHEIGKFDQQLSNVTRACKGIADIAKKGIPIVITHGNGPQVGNLEIRMQVASPKIPKMPLDVEVAMTQGQIGHLIYLGLKKWIPKQRVSIVCTHVEVSPEDKAFKTLTKPIGPWYSEKEAGVLKKNNIPLIFDKKKGYRKAAASPKPKNILELESIRSLLNKKHIVIACGGGGIPVIKNKKKFKGAEAVIDKDAVSQLLAGNLRAQKLMMLTDVEYAYADFYSKKPKKLTRLTAEETRLLLKKGIFGEGSMKPKIESAVSFATKNKKPAYIGQTNKIEKILKKKSGTIIEG